MLSSVILGFVLAVGAHARPLEGHFAQKIDARAVANATYDFVIAGGGIAGMTVADRLSEIANGTSRSYARIVYTLLIFQSQSPSLSSSMAPSISVMKES
jgi:NADH dehydrogenase FAD-containing subunit